MRFSYLEWFLVIALSIAGFIVSLTYLPRDEVVPFLVKIGEICAIYMVLFLGYFAGPIHYSDKMDLAANLAFLTLIGLTAGGIYWALTALGLSARPARFIVWGILAVSFFGLPYLDLWYEGKKAPPPE